MHSWLPGIHPIDDFLLADMPHKLVLLAMARVVQSDHRKSQPKG